jgi:alpha-mannosidase
VKEIVVVFKTHFDIGYTDMATNIVQRYRTTMIDQALEVVDQNRDLPPQQQFAWTLSGWPMHKILQDWPGQSPQRKERVEQALRDGRFVVHGLPFSTHTELLEAEDLVRSLGYSARHDPAPGAGGAARWQDDRRAGAHLDDGHVAQARGH